MLINFVCQLDWAMRCPDIWPDIILDMFVRAFFDEINLTVGRLNKVDCPVNVSGPHAIN